MTREAQKLIFADGEIPTGANYSALIDQIPLIVPLISDLPTAAAGNLGQVYCVGGINYKCTNPSAGVYEWTNMNAAAAANDYSNASNKPKINGVLLSGNKTSKDLGIDTLNSNLFIQDYPFLYFQSDGSMDSENTTSTSELVLIDDNSNTIKWKFTPNTNGIIRKNDEINVQFSTTGLVNSVYNATIELYLEDVKIAEKITTFGNTQVISPQLHKNILINTGTDYFYNSGSNIEVHLTLNKVGGSGSVTIYIYNSSTRSSYLNIRKYIGQSEDTTETNTLDTITLYNSEKNTLRYINHTYEGDLNIRLEPKTSTSKGCEIYGSEHEVVIYNNSGATRTIGTIGIPISLPTSVGGSIDNGKCLYFKYKVINYNSYQSILIITSQLNITIG